MDSLLSVIVPAYNEEQNIKAAYETIGNILSSNNINYEIIFVDDGSADNTWNAIKEASDECDAVRGIHFSRNFGKDSAVMAGLKAAKGDCAVAIDCDLQHPPEKIVDMYRLWEKGYEIVEGVKLSRGKEGILHKAFAKLFYSLITKACGFDMDNTSDFKLLDRKAINAITSLNEQSVFFRAMSAWVGFKSTTVEYEVRERNAGTSKWSSAALVKYAVKNITTFSTAPLQIITVLGIVMFAVSLVIGGISLFKYFTGVALEGFTTVIIIQLFSSSLIMISMGIIGYYIARIFDEVKKRPIYIVSEKCGRGE